MKSTNSCMVDSQVPTRGRTEEILEGPSFIVDAGLRFLRVLTFLREEFVSVDEQVDSSWANNGEV